MRIKCTTKNTMPINNGAASNTKVYNTQFSPTDLFTANFMTVSGLLFDSMTFPDCCQIPGHLQIFQMSGTESERSRRKC